MIARSLSTCSLSAMGPRAACARKPYGLTLVEVMVSLALFGLIMLLLLNSLHTSVRYWEHADSRFAASEETRIIQVFLRNSLSHLKPMYWIEDARPTLLFQGKPDHVRFVSSLPAHRGGGGLHMLTLRLSQQRPHRRQVRLGWRLLETDRFPFGAGSESPQDAVTIMEDIKTLRFEYYGANTEAGAKQWHDTWTNETQVPELIRVTMRPNNTGKEPIELIAAVRVRAPGSDRHPQFRLHAAASP